MAHGIDTDSLLEKIAFSQRIRLYIASLQITSLPPLPKNLQELECSYTNLVTLGELPDSLEYLLCYGIPTLRSLPELLPPKLISLYCADTGITSLPQLPDSLRDLGCGGENSRITLPRFLPPNLEILSCAYTPITILPALPETLKSLNCKDCDRLLQLPDLPQGLESLHCTNTIFSQKLNRETMPEYIQRMRKYQQQESKERCQRRNAVIKEELIAKLFHPNRVTKLLELYGMDWDDCV